MNFMELFSILLLAFLPLFVAIDAIGVLPVFWSLTNDMEAEEKKKLITHSTIAAVVVSVLFLLVGKALFSFLGILESDFRVAGGVVLLIIAVSDLTFAPTQRRKKGGELGVVPIGIPLIVGPAALTTILILVDTYGFAKTLFSILANLGIVWLMFQKSDLILKLVGDAGSRAAGKVMSLFLAAIAVMMIRVGIQQMMHP